MGIFQRLNRDSGITVILITHEHDIAEFGSRIIRFRDGRVVRDQANTSPRQAKAESEAQAEMHDSDDPGRVAQSS